VAREGSRVTITDGAIMFVCCLLSFVIGYALGLIRLGRHVDKRLDEIKQPMQAIEKASRELSNYYAKLDNEHTRHDEV
jgi:hypothetical protein